MLPVSALLKEAILGMKVVENFLRLRGMSCKRLNRPIDLKEMVVSTTGKRAVEGTNDRIGGAILAPQATKAIVCIAHMLKLGIGKKNDKTLTFRALL